MYFLRSTIYEAESKLSSRCNHNFISYFVCLSSIPFCFTRSICGWVGHKHKASKSINDCQSASLFKDVQPSFPGVADHQEREFKLEENDAYDPAQLIK